MCDIDIHNHFKELIFSLPHLILFSLVKHPHYLNNEYGLK